MADERDGYQEIPKPIKVVSREDAEQQGAKLDGPGPFLIGWSPSNSRGIPDKVVLVVNMSSFESQDSFDNAFFFGKLRSWKIRCSGGRDFQ